jgi:hypothetical protein
MKLPKVISDYFEADHVPDGSAPVHLFTPNATVTDEGRTHVGTAAIATWWRNAKREYRHTAEPFEQIDRDGVIEVRAKVTGQFPGSPANLTFVFALDSTLIASLKIGT